VGICHIKAIFVFFPSLSLTYGNDGHICEIKATLHSNQVNLITIQREESS
jgi:hypothetical protein